MNNHTEKRVRRQQKKSSHSPQLSMAPISPPTSPQEGSMTTRWGNKSVDGGSEDDTTGHTTIEKQRSAWTDSSKRKLSPRSSAPDGPTAADPFAGMKTCINYQQEIERLKTLVPKVENKKRSSQHQHQHQRNNSATMIVTEGNLMDTDHNSDSDSAAAAATTANATATATATLPTLTTDHENTTPIISSTTRTTSAPSSSPSSSSSSHISSNSSSSSLSSSHDSISSSSLSSACSPTSINTIIPPTSHSSIMAHENPSSTHTTSDDLVDITPTTTSNHLMEPLNNAVSPKMETTMGSASVITDEEKTRFLEFMRSWTGGLNGWNDQPMEHKGFMWNQQPSRQSQLWTRSEPCSPLQKDVRMDPWSQHQYQQQQQQQQLPQQQQQQQQQQLHQYQYLQQQFHQQLPPATIQLDMGHRQQPCFKPTSPPLQSSLPPKSLQQQQQQQLLYSSSMHPQQKQQASFHQQQYQHHSPSHHHPHPHFHQQQQQQQLQHYHSLHLHQQPALTSKEWLGSSGIIKSSSTLPSQVGTIGDRSSSPSVSRPTSRNHGPFSVSVM